MATARSWADVAWRTGAVLATLVAGAALAFVIAHWAWTLIAPAPVHIAPALVDDPAGAIVAAQLFGAGGPTPDAAPSDAIGELRLLGVIVQRDGKGYAVFRLPS